MTAPTTYQEAETIRATAVGPFSPDALDPEAVERLAVDYMAVCAELDTLHAALGRFRATVVREFSTKNRGTALDYWAALENIRVALERVP